MTKVISISDEAYEELSNLKESGESFSDVIKKISSKVKKEALKDLYGAWKDYPEMDKIFKDIANRRNKERSGRVHF